MNIAQAQVEPEIPDLSDSICREQLSPAALVAVRRIGQAWQLSAEDTAELLGTTRSSFYDKRKNGGELNQDQLTRASLLIGIYKALHILFSDAVADSWVTVDNKNPLFGNRKPVEVMAHGGIPSMIEIRAMLDSRRGGR